MLMASAISSDTVLSRNARPESEPRRVLCEIGGKRTRKIPGREANLEARIIIGVSGGVNGGISANVNVT